MGLLSPYGPPEWHPASEEVKQACKAAVNLCKERDVSLPKIALFNSLQCTLSFSNPSKLHSCRNTEISSTLVGMPTVAQVRQNVETAKLDTLSETEAACLTEVQHLLEPIHNHTWPSGLPENN